MLLVLLMAGCSDYKEWMNYTAPNFEGMKYCGDLFCDPGETNESCPMDCNMEGCKVECNTTAAGRSCIKTCGGAPGGFEQGNLAFCGNGVCDPGETAENCASDCWDKVEFPQGGQVCGNSICEEGEDKLSCCRDCGCENRYACVNNICVACGNGACESSLGESRVSCCNDCGCDKFMCNRNKCMTEYEFFSKVGGQDFLRIFEKINATSVRDQAVSIVSHPPEGVDANEPVWKIFAINKWIYENIKYVSDPAGMDYIANAVETIQVGAGDCDDFAVLSTTMMESVGIDAAYTLVDTDGDGVTDHASTIVYYSGTAREFLAKQAVILKKTGGFPVWDIQAYPVAVIQQFTKTYKDGVWIAIEPGAGRVGPVLPGYEIVYVINVGYIPPP